MNWNPVASQTHAVIALYTPSASSASPWVDTHAKQLISPIMACWWRSAANCSMEVMGLGSAGPSEGSGPSSSHCHFLFWHLSCLFAAQGMHVDVGSPFLPYFLSFLCSLISYIGFFLSQSWQWKSGPCSMVAEWKVQFNCNIGQSLNVTFVPLVSCNRSDCIGIYFAIKPCTIHGLLSVLHSAMYYLSRLSLVDIIQPCATGAHAEEHNYLYST